jgi:hypothetical protein
MNGNGPAIDQPFKVLHGGIWAWNICVGFCCDTDLKIIFIILIIILIIIFLLLIIILNLFDTSSYNFLSIKIKFIIFLIIIIFFKYLIIIIIKLDLTPLLDPHYLDLAPQPNLIIIIITTTTTTTTTIIDVIFQIYFFI